MGTGGGEGLHCGHWGRGGAPLRALGEGRGFIVGTERGEGRGSHWGKSLSCRIKESVSLHLTGGYKRAH